MASNNFNQTDVYSNEEFVDIENLFRDRDIEAITRNYKYLINESTKLRKDKYLKKEKPKTVVDARKLAVATIAIISTITLALGVRAGVNKIQEIRNDIKAENFAKRVVNNETIAFNILSNGEHYTFYDTASIAQKIINYAGSYDLDAYIYCYYINFDYNVLNQMNALFADMHSLIERKLSLGEAVNSNVLSSCNFSNFQDYLKAKGFKSVDDYKVAMDRLLCAYGINNDEERMSKVADILENLDNQEAKAQKGR